MQLNTDLAIAQKPCSLESDQGSISPHLGDHLVNQHPSQTCQHSSHIPDLTSRPYSALTPADTPDVMDCPLLLPQSIYATYGFYAMIVLESCFLPIPPDPFFILQGVKNPKNVWKLASLCTILSTLGGCMMYGVGFLCFHHFGSLLNKLCGGEAHFILIQNFIQHWGAWAMLSKICAPIPYKLLALVAGVTHFSFIVFALTSLVARGSRFFILASLIHKYQASALRIVEKYQSWIRYAGYGLVGISLILLIMGLYSLTPGLLQL